jgi:hypothetical protein
MRERRTVSIPPVCAAGVMDMLVATFAAKADSLAAVAAAYQEGGAQLADVVDARRELVDAEDALDALDWRLGEREDGLELRGPTGLVRETLHAALSAAAEAAVEACEAYEAGRVGRDALAAAVTALSELHELFAAGEPPAGH